MGVRMESLHPNEPLEDAKRCWLGTTLGTINMEVQPVSSSIAKTLGQPYLSFLGQLPDLLCPGLPSSLCFLVTVACTAVLC